MRTCLLVLIAVVGSLFINESAFSITYTLTQDSPLVFNQGTHFNSISAGGLIGRITDVNITLNGLRVNNFFQGVSEHDVLLVSPQGKKIILLAYVCEAFTTPGPINVTFDQSASSLMPSGQEAPCVNGSYKPTDYAYLPPPHTYIFDYPPTPPPPYSANLNDLNNEYANGTWTLYAAEHEGNEGGTIDSWTLTIETDGVPPPCMYEDLFNDGTLTYEELKPSVQETGGNLVLTAQSKKAYAISDSSFSGSQNGTVKAEIRFSSNGGPKERGWLLTHWIDKKNLMEIQFNVERGKVIVKQKAGGVVVKKSGEFALAYDTSYTVEAAYFGTTYDVTINNTLVVSLTPVGTLPSGILGFQARGLTESVNRVCITP